MNKESSMVSGTFQHLLDWIQCKAKITKLYLGSTASLVTAEEGAVRSFLQRNFYHDCTPNWPCGPKVILKEEARTFSPVVRSRSSWTKLIISLLATDRQSFVYSKGRYHESMYLKTWYSSFPYIQVLKHFINVDAHVHVHIKILMSTNYIIYVKIIHSQSML